jgi:chromosome segregation ATPase
MIIIDLLIIFLLILSIWYSHSLHGRINELQKSKIEFNKMLKEFDGAIARAEASVTELNKLNNSAYKKIYDMTQKAEILSDDLSFMNDMGSEVATRLESAISNARNVQKAIPEAVKPINTIIPEVSAPPRKQDIEAILTMINKAKT